MPKRRADAGERRFFDQFERLKASYFRARDIIDPAKNTALIPCASGKTKLLDVAHTRFPGGGGWSFFRCAQCSRRASAIYLVNDAPRCVKCCNAMNIRYRSQYGFGRLTRRQVADQKLDELIAKLNTTTPLRFKPAPASWYGKAKQVYNSRSLTNTLRRNMIRLRLNQLASQQGNEWVEKGRLIKSQTPFADAKSLINIKPIWRARTLESLERALDKAQAQILAALNSNNPQIQASAVKLMLRTKQARERGLGL